MFLLDKDYYCYVWFFTCAHIQIFFPKLLDWVLWGCIVTQKPWLTIQAHNTYSSTYIHICLRNHNDTMKTMTQSFRKIYLSLYCKVCMWEGVGDRTELQHIDPHSYGHQHCVFLVLQGCSTGRPRAQLSTECCSLYRILSLTHLISNSIGGPKGPFCQVVAFSTTSWHQLVWSPTHWLPVFTELYNSSIAHSISLEWHVCSSSSGNNCHAVHRSLSSGESVYECTVGF